jgi:hypothetical protein
MMLIFIEDGAGGFTCAACSGLQLLQRSVNVHDLDRPEGAAGRSSMAIERAFRVV